MTRKYHNDLSAEQDAAIYSTREKMLEAFRRLNKRGLYTRSNFLCCQSCAGAALADNMKKAAASDKPRKGVVYWHGQDEEHFLDSGKLYLAYSGDKENGAVNPDTGARYTTTEIGAMVVEELKAGGLQFEWDGRPESRIVVFAFRTINNGGVNPKLVAYSAFEKVGPEVPPVPPAVRIAFRKLNEVVFADLQSREFNYQLIGQIRNLPEAVIEEAQAWLALNPEYYEYALRSSLRYR